jgi:hypothetical protein
MLSFQDIVSKTQVQRKAIRECLEATSKSKGWHPEDASLYDGLGAADTYEIKEALNNMTLAEVLQKGSTTQGADVIVAAKLHDTLILAGKPYDLCERIGYMATTWDGSDLKVDVVKDGSYTPKLASASAYANEVNVNVAQCTASPLTYSVPVICGNTDIEDGAYSIVQYHVEKAGQACGELASDLAITVLMAAPDGDGTKNSLTTTITDTTDYDEVLNGVSLNGDDQFYSNTLICTSEAWRHGINWVEVVGGTAGDYGRQGATNVGSVAVGFDLKLDMLDVKFWNTPQMHDSTDATGAVMTTCKSVVFDRNNALLTARKRWLEIRNYANPIKDIAGAVINFRQDSVSLYKDAICLITENT